MLPEIQRELAGRPPGTETSCPRSGAAACFARVSACTSCPPPPHPLPIYTHTRAPFLLSLPAPPCSGEAPGARQPGGREARLAAAGAAGCRWGSRARRWGRGLCCRGPCDVAYVLWWVMQGGPHSAQNPGPADECCYLALQLAHPPGVLTTRCPALAMLARPLLCRRHPTWRRPRSGGAGAAGGALGAARVLFAGCHRGACQLDRRSDRPHPRPRIRCMPAAARAAAWAHRQAALARHGAFCNASPCAAARRLCANCWPS